MLRNQGVIWAADGQRMSKSKGNVVTPDAMVEKYGADALRLWELFMGPFDEDTNWNEEGVAGTERFLIRVWSMVRRYVAGRMPAGQPGEKTHRAHKTLGTVTEHRADALQHRARRADGASQLCDQAQTRGDESLRCRELRADARADGAVCRRGVLACARSSRFGASRDLARVRSRARAEETVTVMVQVNGKVRDRLLGTCWQFGSG